MSKCHKQFLKTLKQKNFFSTFFLFKLERLLEKCPSTLTATEEMFLVSIFFMRQMQKKKNLQYQIFNTDNILIACAVPTNVNKIYYQTKVFLVLKRNGIWNWQSGCLRLSLNCSICEHPYPPRLILSSLYVNEKKEERKKKFVLLFFEKLLTNVDRLLLFAVRHGSKIKYFLSWCDKPQLIKTP